MGASAPVTKAAAPFGLVSPDGRARLAKGRRGPGTQAPVDRYCGSRPEWSPMGTRYGAARLARVQSAVDALGYFPDGAAQGRPKRRREAIGFINAGCSPANDAEDTNIFNHEVFRGVQRVASELGWSLLVKSWSPEAGEDFRSIGAMSDKGDYGTTAIIGADG